jgi:hypothetical protein
MGTTTVNPSTGRFAATVGIFNGTTTTGTPVCTANVDPFTGAWRFNSPACAIPTTTFTVKSADGGLATVNPGNTAACVPKAGAPQVPVREDDSQRLKPQPTNKTDKP